jgi:predicted transcriptional regulator
MVSMLLLESRIGDMANAWLGKGRRSSVQIAAAVLKLSDTKETTSSELKRYVKMSHQQTQKYLDWLVELQLLYITEGHGNCHLYRSTPKGKSLVSIIEEIQELLLGSQPGNQ